MGYGYGKINENGQTDRRWTGGWPKIPWNDNNVTPGIAVQSWTPFIFDIVVLACEKW